MSTYRISREEFIYRRSLPLDIKVAMTKTRIREFVREYGLDGVYLSDSGGLDSTVLRHIMRECYPEGFTSVYLDTWLEYPQIRKLIKEQVPNLTVIKPTMSMKEIIQKVGWCFPSKDVAQLIEGVRKNKKWAILKINGLDANGKPSAYRQQYRKWWPLVDSEHLISPGCCIEQKEKPILIYEKETGRHPILALRADESARRTEAYLRTGCNSFDMRYVINEETGEYEERINNRPMSKPMGFWTKQDVLHYALLHQLIIPEPYGRIVPYDYEDEQPSFVPLHGIVCENCPLRTTGENRTGCIFCPIGCHLDHFRKIKRLKKWNTDLYDYCMEELGEKKLLEWVNDTYVHGKHVF